MDTVEKELLSTTDAAIWAKRFVELHGGDEGLMIGWFANAMGTQESHLHKTWAQVQAMHRSHKWKVFRDPVGRKCRECEDTDDTIMRYCPGGLPDIEPPSVADQHLTVPPLEQPGLF